MIGIPGMRVSDPEKKFTNGCVKVLSVPVLAIVVIGVLNALFANRGTGIPRPRQPAPAATPKPKPAIAGIGQHCRLRANGLDPIAVAPQRASMDRFFTLAKAKDDWGMAQMIVASEVLMVPKGTRCLVIDTGFTTREVRILEGKHAGKSGWLPMEWAVSE